MENHDSNPTQHQSNKSNNNDNFSSKIKRLQQRTTTIALSILVAVSVGLVGFELLSAQNSPSIQPSAKGSKSLTILANEREKLQAGLSTNSPATWNVQGNNEEAIKEVNRLQANKIKELKRQLVDANHKLHDVKAHLFTKGDPSDRARLAEICQELVEKERRNEEYKQMLAELEAEKNLKNHKIIRMEHTIDALATMTDTQRETKEKAIFNFQSQIERLQEDARREKNELQKSLAELEESNVELREIIADKLATIKSLEEEISWQYALLEDKDKNIHSQSSLFTQSENHLKQEVNNLSEALELEILKNQNLFKDLEIAVARENAHEQYAKSLENKFSNSEALFLKDNEALTRDMAQLAQEYLELQGVLDVYAHSHDLFTNKHQKLASLVKEEKFRSEALKSELDQALALADAEQQRGFCIEEELHASAHKALQIKDELAQHQALLERKQQELDTLTYSNASLRDQLHERINQLSATISENQQDIAAKDQAVRDLTINVELERGRAQELDRKLQDVLASSASENTKALAIKDELYQKGETLLALEERLEDKKTEIEALTQQVQTLAAKYEEEKIRTNELHTALSHALNENDRAFDNYNKLQTTVAENTDTLFLLQDRIESKKQIIQDMQEKMDQVAYLLEIEKSRSREMEIALNESRSQREAEEIKASRYESELEQTSEQLAVMRKELENKHDQIQELAEQITQSNTSNDNRDPQAKSMKALVKTQEEEIARLQEHVAKLSQYLELEKSRSMAYEKAKTNEQNHTKELENKIHEFSARIAELQDAVHSKEKEIVETEQVRGKGNKRAHTQDNKEMAFNEDNSVPPTQNNTYSKNTASQSTQQAGIKHTVKRGENLSMISTYYYGSPNRWIDIYNANKKSIPDKNQLEVGILLNIPK
jgi:nucleoid-associated protein YgaU